MLALTPKPPYLTLALSVNGEGMGEVRGLIRRFS
jgi:hypothetical protein